jgi:BolA protein
MIREEAGAQAPTGTLAPGVAQEQPAAQTPPNLTHQDAAPMAAEDMIRERLMVALEPIRLDVINESHLHAGHRSSPGTGESHFRVLVVSPMFAGKSRLERHRLVNETLADLLKGKVHALAIKAHAPGEEIK